jgi:hypothetical protein
MRRLRALIVLLSLTVATGFPVARPAAAMPCQGASRLVDAAAASTILATDRPFVPGDRDLFFSFERADWADAAPIHNAQGPGLTEQETRDSLRAFLERRFPCSPDRVRDGLAVFANPTARLKIPDPTLRAALASLTGTLGEPAIAYLLYQAPVAAVHFGTVVFPGESIPQDVPASAMQEPGGVYEIVFDGRHRFDPFGDFAALLFHEALHVESPIPDSSPDAKPNGVGLPEEATAVALETIVYMQTLQTDPTLALLPDELTRGNNHLALVRLNSGTIGTDRLNIFLPGSDVNIDPLAAEPLTEFYEFYARSNFGGPGDAEWRAYETRGNRLLAAVLRALAEPGHTSPKRPDFDRATLDFIDQNLAVLSPADLVTVACTLKLDLPCP